MTKELKEVINT